MTKDLPEAWEIAELERMRRIIETGREERPSLQLPLPPPPPPRGRDPEPARGSTVIVIDLC